MSTTYPLSNIVSIELILDAFPITRVGFGTPLFIGTTDPDTDPVTKVNAFTTLAEVLEIYANSTPEYLAAAAFFGQNPKPTRMLIGYKESGETWVEALNDIRAIDDSWFFLTAATRTAGDQSALAAAVNGIAGYRQAHFVSNDTSNVLNNAITTDIGSVLTANNYLTCYAYYHATASVYPDLAALGKMVVSSENSTRIPGTSALTYKKPTGVPASNLTSANVATLTAKRYTWFQNVAGTAPLALGARSGAGVPFDIVYFLGWLQARCNENAFETISRASDRNERIPFNEKGIDQIEAAYKEVLDIAVTAGVIEPFPVITMPTRESTSFADRANRLLAGVRFNSELSGAIEKITALGYLTV